MAFRIRYNEDKNQILKATRGISFEEVIIAMASGGLVDNRSTPNPSRSHQRIYLVRIDISIYIVPYVINLKKAEIFLKTIYPSRKLTN